MSDFAAVTTVGGSYSRYLGEWADALLAQTRRPEQVAIVDNGTDDPEPVADAADRLRRAGLDVRLTVLPWTVNYGRARNIAVDSTDTEWAAHVDCDDLLMPHALEDWESLAPSADVVGFGWERLGGTPFRRIYRPHQGPLSLTLAAPCSGLSPFRRTLWQRSPYRDDQTGAWDTALWRGFGWLNARFVPTVRPVFHYRWHPDSIFNARCADPHASAVVGRRLHQLASQPPDDVIVVVPWRDPGDPDRVDAWRWLRKRWATLHPDWTVVEADCEGTWQKTRALNDTISGLDCRVLIIADADVTADPGDLEWAVLDAQCYPWVVPHGKVHRLTRTATRQLFDLPADVDLNIQAPTIRTPYTGFPGGGLFVIGRAQWDRAGGMDETFVGWGAEDEAFALAADTLLGPHVRYDRPLIHLYHDPGLRSSDPAYEANRARWRRYRDISGDRAAMAAHVGVKEDR
jgi:hypothetical protein